MPKSTWNGLKRGLRAALRLAARPVRSTSGGAGGLAIQAFRGCASSSEALVVGRVFRQPGRPMRPGTRSGRDAIDLVRRIVRRGVGGAVVRAAFAGAETLAEADRDGYFRVRLRLDRPLISDRAWHSMRLELVGPTAPVAESHVFVAPPTAEYVVISDIDDTVIETGVSNKLVMMWRLFVAGVESRIAFPGVAAFYRALYHGGGAEPTENPIVYVSRGPWSIYDILDRFFRLHRIPIGPVVFLREWGMTLQRPLPPPAREHKIELIRLMLDVYRDLPVILIGDSGQRDPEIYARIVHEHPDRVRVIYIRHVAAAGDERRQAIAALAAEVARTGAEMLLADDSFTMALHAAERGLISNAALREVLREKVVADPPG